MPLVSYINRRVGVEKLSSLQMPLVSKPEGSGDHPQYKPTQLRIVPQHQT
jgi:hypothetical protein